MITRPITSPVTSPVTSRVVGTEWRRRRGYRWYVDSVNGDDSNDGSSSAPYQTLGKLLENDLTDKCVALLRGSHFRESLDLVTAGYTNVTIHGIGDLADPLPKIDGTDVASNAGWTKTDGRTNVYERAWANTVGNRDKAKISVFEDGAFLTWVADVATCDSTPGSFHVQNSAHYANPETVYIHPNDSTNPTTDDKLYEITSRRECLKGDGIFKNIHTTRQANHDGSFIFSGYAENILATFGIVHNLWVSVGARAKNCVTFQAQPSWRPSTGATMYVTYEGIGGSGAQYDGCFAYHDLSAEHTSFTAHTSGGANRLAHMRYTGCRAYSSGGSVISDADTDLLSVTDLFARCGPNRSTSANVVFGSPGQTNIDNATIINVARLIATSISDLRAYADSDINGGILYTAPTSIKNSTIAVNRSLSAVNRNLFFPAAGATTEYKDCVINGAVYRVIRATSAEDAPDSDRNVYHPDSQFQAGATTYATLAEYVAITGTDANSVESDPLLVDPANNDFSFAAGSPANTGGRTAGSRKHIDEPDWTTLKAAWEAGYLGIDGTGPV